MDMERSGAKCGKSVETRDHDESPLGERWKGEYNDLEDDKSRESKHRSKGKSRSRRREEKDHRRRDREKSKINDASKERDKDSKGSVKDFSRDRRKEDREDREKDGTRDKVREKETDREKYCDRERATDKDCEKDRDRETGSEKGKERIREKDREKTKDSEKDRETHGDRNRERIKEREREKFFRKEHEESRDETKDSGKDVAKSDSEDGHYKDTSKHGTGSHCDRDAGKTLKNEAKPEGEHGGSQQYASELEDRIMRMKEERFKKESEDPSNVLSWVSKSRKLEKRIAEKEKALQFLKMLEEQDNQGDDEDEPLACQHTSRDLAGFKVLDGLDKVIEGGSVVLTLKDQSLLADGDINQGIDMLENMEIGEQKRRNEAYKAAKKNTEVFDDKFNDDPGFEKKMIPQYDDPLANEGLIIDERGRFSGVAEKKLELQERIDGASVTTRFEDLTSTGKASTDYYTSEEMKFKKPKKKKSLRKKYKLDIEALEAEARSAGSGAGDHGSRADGKRQAQKAEQERSEAEKRSNAFQSAYIKADEASKALRMEQTVTVQNEDEDNFAYGDDDDEDLRKSLQRARRVALKKQDDRTSSVARQLLYLHLPRPEKQMQKM
ncbi:hypothetical protein OROMI_015722 [Orobanche minor]